jgi:integrase
VLGATWDELDLRKSVWTIPDERTKNGKEHQVPLSAPVVAVLERMSKITNGGNYVFFGQSSGRSLSNVALLVLLRRMKRHDITSHGFRRRSGIGPPTADTRMLSPRQRLPIPCPMSWSRPIGARRSLNCASK